MYELKHSLGTQALLGKRRINIDSAVALGVIKRPGVEEARPSK